MPLVKLDVIDILGCCRGDSRPTDAEIAPKQLGDPNLDFSLLIKPNHVLRDEKISENLIEHHKPFYSLLENIESLQMGQTAHLINSMRDVLLVNLKSSIARDIEARRLKKGVNVDDR